jgi:hypothetical protein
MVVPGRTGDLRAILSTTLALVDYFGDTEQQGAMLIELKQALEHAIGELDVGSAGRPGISLCSPKTKGPNLHK